jgi:hypothetical protein
MAIYHGYKMTDADRHVDLWLSDFTANPYDVAATLPVRPYIVARKGDPYGSRHQPTRQNLIVIRHSFSYVLRSWSDAIDALMLSLGGWDEVERLLARMGSVERMVQLTLPINGSPHQENNGVEAPTLARLARLEIDLGFEFSEYHQPNLVNSPDTPKRL